MVGKGFFSLPAGIDVYLPMVTKIQLVVCCPAPDVLAVEVCFLRHVEKKERTGASILCRLSGSHPWILGTEITSRSQI